MMIFAAKLPPWSIDVIIDNFSPKPKDPPTTDTINPPNLKEIIQP